MVLFCILLALTSAKDAVIDSLVSDLGAREFNRRERATRALGRLGSLAYPQLRKVVTSKDLETRRRAEALVRSIQAEAFRRAAKRQVAIVAASKPPFLKYGTVIAADGREALILTASMPFSSKGVFVSWNDEPVIRTRLIARDFDLGLALLSIPYSGKFSPLPFASGRTNGCWWNHHEDLDASFEESMAMVRTDVFPHKSRGCGIFVLGESHCQLMLGGVNAGFGMKMHPKPLILGPDEVRQFLKSAKAKLAKK